jgi:hypothetical protein
MLILVQGQALPHVSLSPLGRRVRGWLDTMSISLHSFAVLQSLSFFIGKTMYQQVAQEQPQSDITNLDRTHSQRPSLDSLGPTQRPRSDDLSHVLSSNSTDESSHEHPKFPEITSKSLDNRNAETTPRTLKRVIYREWLSILFDALLSLVPLFFLGMAYNDAITDFAKSIQ